MTPFLLALAVYKLVDITKQIIPWKMRPWAISVNSLAISFVLCIGFVSSMAFEPFLLLVGGAAGGAALIHELADVFSMFADEKKQAIVLRATRRS